MKIWRKRIRQMCYEFRDRGTGARAGAPWQRAAFLVPFFQQKKEQNPFYLSHVASTWSSIGT